jgi:uncharacterized protein
MFTAFQDAAAEPVVRGFLHEPEERNGNAVVLTHGAGSNCTGKLLVAVAGSLAARGFVVLRFDLAFRLARAFGPPHPGTAERDRVGIRRAAELLKSHVAEAARGPASARKQGSGRQTARVFLAGHSYGGRQASMLLAEQPDAGDGLLLLSYPLHPPKKAEQLRTAHFPKIHKPAFFVHGTRDPFATTAELRTALELIPDRHELLEVEGAGHELLPKKQESDLPERIARAFGDFVAKTETTK